MGDNKRKPQINFPASEELKEQLKFVSRRIQVPSAQIAREALWEKIEKLKESHPRLQSTVKDGVAASIVRSN